VSGWRKQRQDHTWSRKLPSWVANRLISAVTGVRLHDYGCALKVYRRPILANVKLYGEMHRFIPALAVEAGARLLEVPVRHHPRTPRQLEVRDRPRFPGAARPAVGQVHDALPAAPAARVRSGRQHADRDRIDFAAVPSQSTSWFWATRSVVARCCCWAPMLTADRRAAARNRRAGRAAHALLYHEPQGDASMF